MLLRVIRAERAAMRNVVRQTRLHFVGTDIVGTDDFTSGYRAACSEILNQLAAWERRS